MAKKLADRYPPLFVEALAYHESGHALMAVLFDVPIDHIAIADKCLEPGYNGWILWANPEMHVSRLRQAFISVGSEAAEKLAPHFDQFKTLHQKYRHLKPFAVGVKNDIRLGFSTIMDAYAVMGFAESTAKQYFKRDIREAAAQIIELNSENVIALAEKLRKTRYVDGRQAVKIIKSAGGPTTGDVLQKYESLS